MNKKQQREHFDILQKLFRLQARDLRQSTEDLMREMGSCGLELSEPTIETLDEIQTKLNELTDEQNDLLQEAAE